MRIAAALVALLLTVSLVGCPGADPTQTGNPQRVQTPIPEGVYEGEITSTSRFYINGDLQREDTVTDAYGEIINADGLPLLEPGDHVPAVGLTLTFDAENGSSTLVIEAIEVNGNTLVITYTNTWVIQGTTLAGTGTWTYEFIAPNTLNYSGAYSGISEPVNGQTAAIEIVENAALTS